MKTVTGWTEEKAKEFVDTIGGNLLYSEIINNVVMAYASSANADAKDIPLLYVELYDLFKEGKIKRIHSV